jgi:hypothetical protein
VAILTFFGTGTPPGTWTHFTDGDPTIVAGTGFYFTTGSPIRGKNIIGGRAYVPAGKSGETVRIRCWRGTNQLPGAGSGIDLAGTPLATVDVTIPDNTVQWVDGIFASPVAISTDFYMYGITVEYLTAPGDYHFGASVRGTMPSAQPSVPTWYWAEQDGTATPQYAGVFYRIGSATTVQTGGVGSYGTDIIIDDLAGSNVPPTANAGSDQTVTAGTVVTLNGSGSSDSDGTIVSYAWTQTGGTSVTLSGSGTNRTFTPATAGVRTFQLQVTDDDGATGTDSVTVTVNAGGGGNVSPSANAGPDQSVDTGQLVTLSGSGSSDPDGTVASYAWVQTSGPTVTLTGSGANRTFTPTVAGTYTFGLTVTDNLGAASAQDTLTVTASTPSGALTVAQENALTPTHGREYWLDGLGTTAMPAFGRSTYYLPGQNFQMSVNYNLPFTFDIYRLGHYGGSGGRRVATGISGTPTSQPAATLIPGGNGAVTCAAWSVNGTWAVPVTAVPGWYAVTLKGTNGVDFGQVLFCVSDKNNKKSVLIVASDATWHAAYNGYGGNNVYGDTVAIGNQDARAFCSTYDKPVITLSNVPQTHFFNNTYPYLKWSESVGVNAGVTTIEQIKNDPAILDGRQVIVWTGHNEYIPQVVMDKTKALLDTGCNMMNISGNDFFWRVKFTNGAFSSSTDGRVMWCKKDTMSGPSSGPDATPSHVGGTPYTTNADWTGTWQDTRWSLREPSYEFFGDQFIANGIRSDSVRVPFSMKGMPAWRDCAGVQALTTGQSYSFAAGTLGMEWDQPDPNTELEWVPFAANSISVSASDVNGQFYNLTANGQHAFMALRSGNSYVLNFNSDQWGWALDSLHLRGSTAPDVNARQMMLNSLYDLGASANGSMVTATGLAIPTPVSNFGAAYGLTPVTPPPPVTPAGANITVLDTPTLDLTITGDGSVATPYVISGVASPELGYSQSTRMFYSDGTNWHEL